MYIQPQIQVFQEFSVIPQAAIANLNAFVFGPHYVLRRYENTSTREELFAGTYAEGEQYELSYPSFPGNAVVDQGYVRLYLENVRARYARIAYGSQDSLAIAGGGNLLQASPSVTEVEKASTTNGVAFEAGGALTSTPAALPDDLFMYADGSVWSILASTNFGLQPTGAEFNLRTALDGATDVFSVAPSDTPLQSGVNLTGPYGIVFDFNTASTPRRAFQIQYTGQPDESGPDSTLTIGGTTVTFGSDFPLGSTASETYEALANYLHAEVPAVLGVIHKNGRLVVILAPGGESVNGSIDAATVSGVENIAAVRKPVEIDLVTSAGLLRVNPEMSALSNYFTSDAAGAPVSVSISSGSVEGTDFNSSTNTLELQFESETTLEELRSRIEMVAGHLFRVAAEGDRNSTGVQVFADGLTAKSEFVVIPDLYKISLAANPTVFATGNGFDASSMFSQREVAPGDAVTVRYADPVTGGLVTTKSRVTALQGIPVESSFQQPVEGEGNQAGQFGDSFTLNPGAQDADLPSVQNGPDNQMGAAGPRSGIFYLEPGNRYMRADYVNGSVEEDFVVRVTAQGLPGQARATVSTRGGTQQRANVPIVAWENDTAAIELGSNLWMILDPEVHGSDPVFRIGDVYRTSKSVRAPWSTLDNTVSVSGKYTGPRDTNYIVSVIRGGTFTQSVRAVAGLRSTSSLTIEATGPITLEVGGYSFTGTLAQVAADVSAEDVMVSAYISEDSLVIRGDASLVSGAVVSGEDNKQYRIADLQVSANFNVTGDKSSEYTLRCTTGGPIQMARFSVEGTDGFTLSNIFLPGFGYSAPLAGSGLSVAFETGSGPDDVAPVFREGDSWTIVLDAARPRVRVSDTAGVEQSRTVTVEAGGQVSLGVFGLVLRVGANSNTNGVEGSLGGLLAGDSFVVEAHARSEGALSTIRIADTLAHISTGVVAEPLVGVDFNLTFESVSVDRRDFEDPGSFTWYAGVENVAVNGNLRVEAPGISGRLPVESGRMYVSYRALSNDYTSGIYSFEHLGSVSAELGEIHPDNPLAQGVYHALLNAGGRSVYFAATPSDDMAGYEAVLDLASKTDRLYALVPMSRDQVIIDMVAGHVHAMSAEDVKQWRIAFVGVQTDSIDVLVEGNATLQVEDGVYRAVFSQGAELMSRVGVGDTVHLGISADAWGTRISDTYRVVEVESNSVLQLTPVEVVSGTITAMPEPVEVTRVLSNPVRAQRVAARSSSLSSRRMYSIFPEEFYYNGVTLTSEFAAAAVAGLVSSMAPQRPLTNVELVGIGTIQDRFGREDLNTMAEGGTFILAQDLEGGRTYVRHQISTQMADGNLYTSELSITKNLDAVSYYLSNLLSPFHGRYNITPELVRIMHATLYGGLEFLMSDRTGTGLIGPMLLTEGTAVREVTQHPVLKDQIVAIADVGLPVPNNVTQLRLVV